MASVFKTRRSRFYVIRYRDERGNWRQLSAKTTHLRTASQLARKIEDRTARLTKGLDTAREVRAMVAAAQPVADHLAAYLAWCRDGKGQAKRHMQMKEAYLDAFIDAAEVGRLADIDADAVNTHLQSLVDAGKAARTVNAVRSHVVGFLNWCRDDGRVASHDLNGKTVPKRDEAKDCRRNRRAFTDAELDRLLRAAKERDAALADRGYAGRYTVYLTAARTGLRRSELAKLRWQDIDLDGRSLRVRAEASKAGREDIIPLHADVAAVLADMKPDNAAGSDAVFRTMPTIRTLYLDLADAGVQAVQRVKRTTDADGTVRKVNRITPVPDAGGRILDFHSFRTTLGTALAKAGVAPLHHKRIMRHSSLRTTDRHYTDLRLADLNHAMDKLAATGKPDDATSTLR